MALPADARAFGLGRSDGLVVGTVGSSPGVQAAILYPTQMVLGTVPGTFSAEGLATAQGQVVGVAQVSRELQQAFAWLSAMGFLLLDMPGGLDGVPLGTVAMAVNSAGSRGGYYAREVLEDRLVPVLWAAGTPPAVTILPTLAGTPPGQAEGFVVHLADSGQACGSSETAAGDFHATLWEGGLPVDLQTLTASQSVCQSQNEQGQRVGIVYTDAGPQPFVHTALSGMVLLPVLAGETRGSANGITENGTIVGRSCHLSAAFDVICTATRWVNGTPVALHTLVSNPSPGWVLENALGIAETDLILVQGSFNGAPRSFVLLPDPPETKQHREHRDPKPRGPRGR